MGRGRKLALMDKEWDFRGQWAPMQEKSEPLRGRQLCGYELHFEIHAGNFGEINESATTLMRILI